ncbi:MAG: hypothetical protein ACK559_27265, partial [bacterium]
CRPKPLLKSALTPACLECVILLQSARLSSQTRRFKSFAFYLDCRGRQAMKVNFLFTPYQ